MKTKEKGKEKKVKTKEKKDRKVKTKEKKERKAKERKAKERKEKESSRKKEKKERQKVRESKRFKNTTNNVPRKEVKQTPRTSRWKCSRIGVGMLFAGTPTSSSMATCGSMTRRKRSIGG